eukprot:CAMPEP_0184860222 /NCGR_PEP_ID=MMETSP0580-20130426/5161_1 /TAXON_ID=1118495 /ORGANISM="Dactyliosolen fragilissimus" /LENGTH=322 /DNA_ID=CAMNT_0027357257 /DNA_START=165 /DNA_END=1133 /DNA_ORIENTATION=-
MANKLPPHALEISPENVLQFTLTRSNSNKNERSEMKLRHPGSTGKAIAFKVKTTQPRRYLVRPNQGLLRPGEEESVVILLVDKDRKVLLDSYDQLGDSALENTKDKFLVQSCMVEDEFTQRYPSRANAAQVTRETLDALTSMWNITAGKNGAQIFNLKLQVKHSVEPESANNPGMSPAPTSAPSSSASAQQHQATNVEAMTPEQMFVEISALRRKYDELVSFSVNLTAERDILNNTLEQTKRDLNREIAARMALENGGTTGTHPQPDPVKGGTSFFTIIFIALIFLFLGIKLSQNDQVIKFIEGVPLMSSMLGFVDNVQQEL